MHTTPASINQCLFHLPCLLYDSIVGCNKVTKVSLFPYEKKCTPDSSYSPLLSREVEAFPESVPYPSSYSPVTRNPAIHCTTYTESLVFTVAEIQACTYRFLDWYNLEQD